MATIPDLTSFGDIPLEMLPEFDPLAPEDVDQLTESTDETISYGVDFAMDFSDGCLMLTEGGDLIITDEKSALEQWVIGALMTPRGHYLLYDFSFGSDINEILGKGFDPNEVQGEIVIAIKESLLVHDRIERVENFKFTLSDGVTEVRETEYPHSTDELTIVMFDVVTDSSERINFSGIAIS